MTAKPAKRSQSARTSAAASSPAEELKVDRRRTNMRAQIEAAATELFFRHGFEATSIRMIADACGITHGALYSHFATKEDVLFGTIERAIAETEQMMVEAMAQAAPDPRSQFVAAVKAFVHFHAAHRLVSLLASSEYSSLPEPRLSQVKAWRIRIRAIFERVILAGQRSGDFKLVQSRGVPAVRLASIALGDMCIRVAEWFNPDGAISAEKMAELYAELGLRLVGAKPESE
ncbi:TetR/AcrR family transcriptional regulator [Steroidobacter cummioxidans]|uniref:TetR/AcrR family transcriptional regulator n=1 Tax=Steroidobacter cummioxidans TaxID=1803913 RepID=UPI000E323EE4|nr:TetR/AcrR family transcriptional regulator [Steroidobacter cummioxidans]